MSKMLFNEYPLLVSPALATKIGLNEAIMLQQIHYWLLNPKSVEIDGRKWHYDTYENWQAQFPFWSVRTIKRIAESLRKQNLVISKSLNKDKSNRTLYYTINYDTLQNLEVTIKL